MKLVSGSGLLKQASTEHFAIGHFNVNGVDWITAYLQTAQKLDMPIIIATSDRVVDALGGFRYLHEQTILTMERLEITVPVVLHLDHGQTVERAMEAIDAGYTSVMFDGSKLPFQKNLDGVKRVVDYASRFEVSVEAEIGAIGGNENGLISGVQYASVADALEMQETGIDYLAAGLGSVHGDYVGEPNLNFERMQEIKAVTGLPLVLHGASGIPDDQIIKAISRGIAKVNINTEVNYAWMNAVREAFNRSDVGHEPIPVLTAGIEAIKKLVTRKSELFGVVGKNTR